MPGFIQKLQDSGQAAKKKWLIAATSIVMLIIITLWSLYISSSLKGFGWSGSQSSETSFSEIFNNSAKILGEGAFAEVKNLFGGAREFSASTANLNFVLESLEPVAPKKLP